MKKGYARIINYIISVKGRYCNADGNKCSGCPLGKICGANISNEDFLKAAIDYKETTNE